MWGSWVRGHSDATTYARNLNRYVAEMKRADPAIRVIAVGDNDMQWNRTVLASGGPNIDLLAIHHYYMSEQMGGDLANLFARPLFYQKFYSELGRLIQELAPGKKIKLAI